MAAKKISVKKYVVRLSGEERERLEALLRKGKSPAQRLLKARILLKGVGVPRFAETGRRKMRPMFTIAAAALLLVGAPAQAERAERDPDKMAVIAATILIFDRDCEKVSPKLEEAAGVATEVAGKPKVAAVIMRIEDQIEKDGKEAWCALARKNFPPLTER